MNTNSDCISIRYNNTDTVEGLFEAIASINEEIEDLRRSDNKFDFLIKSLERDRDELNEMIGDLVH